MARRRVLRGLRALFADSREGPLAGDGIGDLRGLIERLDYLNDGDPATDSDLDVTALWLMPIAQSPSYHGYDVTDYRRVEPDYGTAGDFRELVDEAHRRGIRVIVDLVLNHTSDRHPWFVDGVRSSSPRHDWYVWSTDGSSYLGPWGQPVWHQLPWWQRGWRHFDYLAYYGLFSRRMPDLDYRNQAVTEEMLDVARFWLRDMGADGFRLDAIRHLIEDGAVQEDSAETHEWLRGFHRFCRSVRPEALLVGEVGASIEVVGSYGADELDLAFQFGLADATLRSVRLGDRGALAEALVEVEATRGDAGSASFLSNHDQNRVMWHVDGRRERAELAAALLLTGPGTPFLYYGEEIGMTGRKPDPLLRTPMQWSARRHGGFSSHRPWQRLQPDFERVNVASQLDDRHSLLSAYRRLIRLRSSHPALAEGATTVLETGSREVHAVLRTAATEQLMVIANLSEQAVSEYRLELPVGVAVPADAARELVHGTEVPDPFDRERPLPSLGPSSFWVIVLNPGGTP